MAKWARGKRAWGEDARSGKRLLRKNMVEDGYVPGLLVAPDWYDPPQEQEKPIKVTDAMALRRPAPRRDKASDIYGPDERFDDEQLVRKPSLAAAVSLGPFSIVAGITTMVDDSGNDIVTDLGDTIMIG